MGQVCGGCRALDLAVWLELVAKQLRNLEKDCLLIQFDEFRRKALELKETTVFCMNVSVNFAVNASLLRF